MGRYEDALDCLEAALEEGVWHVTMLYQSSMFDPLRDLPRFDALLREIGFDPVA